MPAGVFSGSSMTTEVNALGQRSAESHEITPGLEAFLRAATGSDARVTSATRLAGGASRDSWAVDVEMGAPEGPSTLELVLRRDLGGKIRPDALERVEEFAVLEAAHDAGVMAPRPFWVCADPSYLERPFFLMQRVEGEAVGRRLVRDDAFAAAREVLPRQMGEQLARIHSVDYRAAGLGFLEAPPAGVSPAVHVLGQLTERLDEIAEPHPALELGITYLAQDPPPCDQICLVHGDFRVGNLQVGPEGLRAVIDWEFAHLGDPSEDVAWPCLRDWRFGNDSAHVGGMGDRAEYYAAYSEVSGREVDPAAVAWWEMEGNLAWAIGCLQQARRHTSGEEPSVELASLGRRACEMELELLDLIGRAEAQATAGPQA